MPSTPIPAQTRGECDCGSPTEGKWAGIHSPHCASYRTPATIREAEAKDTSRAAAFERFKLALAAADISPSDRYRIHVAGCEYASAAAQEMLTEFDATLRAGRHGLRVIGSLADIAR